MSMNTQIQLRVAINGKAAKEVQDFIKSNGQTEIKNIPNDVAEKIFFNLEDNAYGSHAQVMNSRYATDDNAETEADFEYGLLVLNTLFGNNTNHTEILLDWLNENKALGEAYLGSFVGTVSDDNNHLFLIEGNGDRFFYNQVR